MEPEAHGKWFWRVFRYEAARMNWMPVRADAEREFRHFGKALTRFALKVDLNRFVTKFYSYYFLIITL